MRSFLSRPKLKEMSRGQPRLGNVVAAIGYLRQLMEQRRIDIFIIQESGETEKNLLLYSDCNF